MKLWFRRKDELQKIRRELVFANTRIDVLQRALARERTERIREDGHLLAKIKKN